MENATRKRGACLSRERAVHLAIRIVEKFERVLSKHEIKIPSLDRECIPDDDRAELEAAIAQILMDDSRGE